MPKDKFLDLHDLHVKHALTSQIIPIKTARLANSKFKMMEIDLDFHAFLFDALAMNVRGNNHYKYYYYYCFRLYFFLHIFLFPVALLALENMRK